MAKFIALDTSSSDTGWAVYVDGKLTEYDSICLKKVKDGKERMKQMCKSIIELLNNVNPDLVYWETPSVVRNPQVQRMLTMIVGVVYGWCVEHEKYDEELRPTEWRKFANKDSELVLPRKREELKQWSMARVNEIFGFELENDDIADAILLGYAMLKKYSE